MCQLKQMLYPFDVQAFGFIGQPDQFLKLILGDSVGLSLDDQFSHPSGVGGLQALVDLYQEFGFALRKRRSLLAGFEREKPSDESLQLFLRHLQRGFQQLFGFNLNSRHNVRFLYDDASIIRRRIGQRPDTMRLSMLHSSSFALRQRMTTSRPVMPNFNLGEFPNRSPKTIYARE